jgi:hypothetical protein
MVRLTTPTKSQHPQRSENPRSTQDSVHDGGRLLALNRRSRTRRDGLYRTLGTYLTSEMAGRDCLPATHSDSATHARRAHAYRELQNTPFMRLRHASGSTLRHPSSSSGHANKACMCSAPAPWLLRKPHIIRTPSFSRPLQLPDTRSAPSAPRAHSRHRHAMRAGAHAQHCKGGRVTHLPGPRAPEATPQTISCLSGLHFAVLARICAKQGERAAVESRASSRVHLLACPAINTAPPKDSRLYWVF